MNQSELKVKHETGAKRGKKRTRSINRSWLVEENSMFAMIG